MSKDGSGDSETQDSIKRTLQRIDRIDVLEDKKALRRAFESFRVFFATKSYDNFCVRFQILNALSKHRGGPYLTKKMILALVPELTEEEVAKALAVLTSSGFLETEGKRYKMTKHSRLSIQLVNLIVLFLAREEEGRQLEYLDGLSDFESRMGFDTGAIHRAISHLVQEVDELQKARTSDSPLIIRRAVRNIRLAGKVYDNLMERAMSLPESDLSLRIQKDVHNITSKAHEAVAAIDKEASIQSISQFTIEWLGAVSPRSIEEWLISTNVDDLATHMGRCLKAQPTSFSVDENALVESYELVVTGEIDFERPLPETVLADIETVDELESEWPLDLIENEIRTNLQRTDSIPLVKFVPKDSWEESCGRMHSVSMLSSHQVCGVSVRENVSVSKCGVKCMTDGDISERREE